MYMLAGLIPKLRREPAEVFPQSVLSGNDLKVANIAGVIARLV